MSFSDLFFLYLFLPVCLLIYYRSRTLRIRNLILIIFSLIFYAWAEPVWIVLLIVSSVVNWFLGLQIVDKKGAPVQKVLVGAAVVYNIAMLLIFKYSGFFVENLNTVFRLSLAVPKTAQPIGLSFYTFRAISYILDVYWGKNEPQKKFSLFLLYLSFFPHMTAGPITRYGMMEKELTKRRATASDMYEGTLRLIVGLAKKVIIADHLITIADNFFGTGLSGLSMMGTWYTAIVYMLYIYFDFSGYTDMALGIAQLFGFRLNENFKYPFLCKNIQEFWQRWHISLGTFFRDYLLYIPLFGKRRKYASLFLVWFCTGFWHGASWNYIIWGLYYGCFVFLEEKLGRKRLKAWPEWWKHVYSLLVIAVGQGIYYFSGSVRQLGSFLLHITGLSMLTGRNGFVDIATWTSFQNNLFLIIIAVAACFPLIPKLRGYVSATRNDTIYSAAKIGAVCACAFLLIICSIMLVDSTNSPFLYWNY